MFPWLTDSYQNLAQRATNHSLHHALIFKGLRGIGKSELSVQLARFLLCQDKNNTKPCGQCQSCLLFEAESHPDFHKIESEKQIGVDLIREAIQKLIGTSQLSGNKVLVLFQADSMTEAAANALLKTLEEPTLNTYIILVCDYVERLLPTILSRCEKVQLNPPDLALCINWLEENGHTDVDQSFVKLYANAPLTIKSRLSNEKTLSYQDFLLIVSDLQAHRVLTTDIATKWLEDAPDMLNWLKFLIHENVKRVQDDELWALYHKCVDASRVCRNPGVNKTLLLSGVLEALSLVKIDLVGAHKHAG